MPTVNRNASTAASRLTDNRRTLGERKQMVALLDKTVQDLGSKATKNKASLQRETYYSMETTDGRFLPDFHLDQQERSDTRSFNSFTVDPQRGEFYFTNYSDTFGPLKLPQGFHYDALFPNTAKDPAARTKGHKALKLLTKAINDQEPQVYGQPWVDMDYDSQARTWRTPAGGKLHDASPYDKRFNYGGASFMFDLRKKEFWLEQVPGISGQCKGPYKLPAGFKKEDISAIDKLDFSSNPSPASASGSTSGASVGADDSDAGYSTRSNFDTDTSRRRSSSVVGSDDSDAGYTGPRLRDVGGAGSGSPMRTYFRRSSGGGGS